MFSVIIPLYNKAQSITATLNSVLSQSFEDFEIVLVNDGSTDGSLEIAKQIVDSRIRIINKENGGVSSARNRGIKEAKFEWIAFLDGDDLWMQNHLNHIILIMNTYPEDKVFATSFMFSDNRNVFKYSRNKEISVITDYFKEALNENLLWTGAVVINKQCFFRAGLFNEQLSRGEDLDLWARVAKYFTIIKSTKITAIYNVGSENKLTSKKSHLNKSILSVISLKNIRGSERLYYKKMLLKRIKSNIKDCRLGENIFLIVKHNFQLFK